MNHVTRDLIARATSQGTQVLTLAFELPPSRFNTHERLRLSVEVGAGAEQTHRGSAALT